MKTLQHHIEEKLIINKDFDNKYKCIQPHNNVCLELALPYRVETDIITLYYKYYRYDKKNDVVIDNADNKFKKNKDGYYCLDLNRNYTWILLFDDDAITFLNALLKNPKQKIDVYDICKNYLSHKNTYEYYCKDEDDNFYSAKRLKDTIEKIQ